MSATPELGEDRAGDGEGSQFSQSVKDLIVKNRVEVIEEQVSAHTDHTHIYKVLYVLTLSRHIAIL